MSGVRSAFNCSFVACRAGLRKCWHFLLCYRPHIFCHEYQVLCLGLSGSGKSTLLARLVGESANNLEPTNGFNIKTLPVNGQVLSIKELGGSERVQMFWAHYYENKHALLFVVDIAASDDTLRQSLDILRQTLASPSFRGRPCLIIGTHQDRPDARSKQQVEEQVREVMLAHKWGLFCCSAFDRNAIQEAINSLTMLINNVFPRNAQ